MPKLTDEQAIKAIAKNLKKYRGNLSYSEVARRAKTYPMSIQRIENCIHMPGAGLLTRIAEALDVTVDDLLQSIPKKNSA